MQVQVQFEQQLQWTLLMQLDFAVGEVIEFYSDAGGTVYATGHEAQKYEITAVDTSAETITLRQLDDPAGSGLIADLQTILM